MLTTHTSCVIMASCVQILNGFAAITIDRGNNVPFIKITGKMSSQDKKEKLALKEMKRRARAHEREQEALLARYGESYVPDVSILKPRSRARRNWCRTWLAENQFKYVKLCWDIDDFAAVDRVAESDRHEQEARRKSRGWDPMAQARGPLCHTDLWPWPRLPPFLVEDVLNSYVRDQAREELERDLNISRENRFRVEEFLQAVGLNQEFFRCSKENALPRLPVNVPLFVLGMQSALGVASATAGVDN